MATKKHSHMWTKDQIKTVVKLWESESNEDICKKLGVESQQLNYIVMEMRKAGFKLPKKHKAGKLRSLLLEVKNEING